MPALITHDSFGHEAYERLSSFIGESQDEMDAFILGNQGPDPLFYARAVPGIMSFGRFGSTMHSEKTDELVLALHDSLDTLTEEERPVGRAYALGFLCHYLLDSAEHPLVYAQEFALCDAGVEGLSRKDGSEVHALIESELDEVMLFTRTGKTIATYRPQDEILKASDTVLGIIGKLYSYVAVMAYGKAMTSDVFGKCVKGFRFVQGIFYAPSDVKRDTITWIETRVRPYSFYRAMSHRVIEATECDFDNHQHDAWVHPFNGEITTASFFDLFNAAQNRVEGTFNLFDQESFGSEEAHQITGGLNFSGNTRKGCEQA